MPESTVNMQEMQRLANDIDEFVKSGTILFTTWVHMGTIQRLGSAPGTPVDTGEAMSGGRLSLNSPSTFRPTPGLPHYTPAGLSHIRQVMSRFQLGDKIYWTNNVPHASILEGGRRYSAALGRMIGSNQAPDGYFHLAIAEAQARLKSWKFVPGTRST